jgi:hypothetical protein
VRRRDWDEEYDDILTMVPEAVRLERLNQGASILDSHAYQAGLAAVLGNVVPGSARVEGGKLIARLKLSRVNEVAKRVAQDLRDGLRFAISAGYKVHQVRDSTSPVGVMVRTVTDWEPLEISLVPVAAEESGTGF